MKNILLISLKIKMINAILCIEVVILENGLKKEKLYV